MSGDRPTALRSWHPVLRNQLVAIVAGLLLFASFPPRTLWFLAPIGIAILVLVLRDGRTVRGGFGYGMLAGLGFFLPLLPWIGVYVGPAPWLALSAVCALYVGLFGALTRLVTRLPGAPVWIACVWSATEWCRSSFPFGGFPWGRLAFGQPSGAFLPVASLGGAPLVSFAVAACGAGLAYLVATALGTTGEGTSRRWTLWPTVTAVVALLAGPVVGAALSFTLPGLDSGDRSITVAAIQGSVPRLGLDFNEQRRAVLDNHVRRTNQLAADVAAGRAAQPDVVIWPENASDIDPLRNQDAYDEITAASRAVRAPILVGAVLLNGDRTTTNSVIVWNGDSGPGDRHDKKIIQPFGEYLPWRGFFRHFSSYADRAGYFVPGHGDGVVRAAGIPIGVATCYEVAFDRAFQQSVDNGAQLLAVPTNNATFGDTEMTYQQLAMSRVRAVEHGRALVVAATSGVSAIVAPNGSVVSRSALFTPDALVSEVPLRTTHTIASRVGPVPEYLLVGIAAVGIAAGLWLRRKSSADSG